MVKLAGKVAVVTGGSKGIGAGIARELGSAGAAVVVNYASDRAGAARVVADIRAQGGDAIAVRADVSKSANVKRLFERTKEAFGPVDVLVNNAAVYSFIPFEEVTENEFHREFNTNVLGLILTTQAAVKQFGERGGSVINISSSATQSAPAMMSLYSATKGAVDMITRVSAKELGPKKIRVNAINPGMTETEGLHTTGILGFESDFRKQVIAQTPLGRIGQPSDIAKIAVFLASEDAGWLTGGIFVASGGL